MSVLSLKYGGGVVTLNIKNAADVEKTVLPAAIPMQDVGRAFVDAASYQCVGCGGLNTLASLQDTYTIVLRAHALVHMEHIVSMLTYYLNSLGVSYDNMAVLCADGTNDADRSPVPADLASRLQVAVHQCDSDDLVFLDKSGEILGHPLLKGRKVILVDCIARDPLTGYTGGAQCLLNACARGTIEHCYAKAYSGGALSPAVQSGIVVGNPLCDAMTAVARKIKPFFAVYAITDALGQFVRFVCGDWFDAWSEGCKLAQQQFALPLSSPADIVVASCGGHPYDSTLLSSYTALCHAAQALGAPGGTIILAAEGRDGGPKALLDGTVAPNSREGVTLAALRTLTKTHRVLMQSKINTQVLGTLGIEAFRTMETLEAKVDFTGKKVRFLPLASVAAPCR